MSQETDRFPSNNLGSVQAPNAASASFNEISQEMLLLLSSGQGLSIHEISRALNIPMEAAWKELISLEQSHFVLASNGKVRLGTEGLRLLEKWGIIKPSPTPPQSTRVVTQKLPVALVGNFPDLIIWGVVPLAVFLVLLLLLGAIFVSLKGMLPFDERIAEIPVAIVITVIALIVLQHYWQLSFHQIPEYESYVVFRLGNCIGSRGPGPTLLNPLLDRWNIVDLRVSHLEVPHETCITRDNVQIDVDFVLYWKVEQPVWSVTKVQSPQESLNLLATALLRAVIAHFPFNEVLNQRERINEFLKEKIDEISTDWGVYVTTVEIREIKPPEDIVDSMHLQAAAEWKRQATVTESEGYKQAAIKRAEGDSQALGMLFDVAKGIDPKTLQLKYLDALAKLGESNSTKYVFPLEFTQLVKPFVRADLAMEPRAESDSEIQDRKEIHPSHEDNWPSKAKIIGEDKNQAA